MASALLKRDQKLILMAEKNAWEITNRALTPLDYLHNNHDECDTLAYLLIANTDYRSYMIRSTDSDLLFIACLNCDKLANKSITLQYNTYNSTAKYMDCNMLFTMMEEDANVTLSLIRERGHSIPKVFGILHYGLGSDLYESFAQTYSA